MKYVKRMGVNVFVSVNEQYRHLIPSEFSKKRLTYPYVLFTDTTLKKNYGFYTHHQIKSQKFSTIFRETKSKIKAAKKSGELAGIAPKEDEAAEDDLIEISVPALMDWTSAQGSTIRAKLVSYRESSKTYSFKLENGKTIKVESSKLAPASVAKARELVEAE